MSELVKRLVPIGIVLAVVGTMKVSGQQQAAPFTVEQATACAAAYQANCAM